MTDRGIPAWWWSHRFAWAALAVAAVAIAASVTGLWNQFAYDDIPIIVDNPVVQELRAVSSYFGETYWGPARGHAALYRPLAVLGYALQWAAGDGSALIFHAVNVGLYAGVCVALLGLLRQWVDAGPAVVAAAIFAAHPVHVEAVANVVGQAELWVGVAMLGALALYARARRHGSLRWPLALGIACTFAASLFIKEHAILLPALLVLVEWVGRRHGFADAADDWRRLRLLVLGLGVLAAAYLFLRAQLLGAVTGDEPHWALRSLGAGERALVMLALVPEIARLLLWPARLYADYSPQHTPVVSSWSLLHLPGLLVLAGVGAALLSWRRAPLVAAAVVWFGLTFLPVSNLLYPVGVLLAERTLFLPSVAVAFALAWVAARAAMWAPPVRSLAAAGVVAAVGLGVTQSAIRSRVWEDNATLFSALAVEAPTNFRAPFALAEFNVMGGRMRTADSLFQRSLELYPEHVPARLAYVQFLQTQRRCADALPLLRASIRDDPQSEPAVVGTVICLMDSGRYSEARRVGLLGISRGFPSPALRELRQLADSMLVATDSIDARNRWWREGRPFDRTGKPLRVQVERRVGRVSSGIFSLQGVRRSASDSTGEGEEPPP